MNIPNPRQKSVNVHDFAMNPRADVPRSVFRLDHGRKTAFSFSWLVPILVEEVLPGDTWRCGITTVARTAVPIVPIQDNWHLEFFSFFVPIRLVWANARKFWGEQDNPGDSINYTVPQCAPNTGYATSSLQDYMGLITVGQNPSNPWTHNALPLRCYNKIWNDWFRDENLQNSLTVQTGDGPDSTANYFLQNRGKRFDYITQALPWPQKGNTAISLPLGSSAIVRTQATANVTGPAPVEGIQWRAASGLAPLVNNNLMVTNAAANNPNMTFSTTAATAGAGGMLYPANLYADLTTATAATINQLRQAITLQQYLEKDARGGTRYTEYVFTHFGVRSPDARLQRPEFIGGGHASILTTAIPQTSGTGASGQSTPLGQLAATGHAQGRTGFTYSATEHGYLLTLVSARADITYQQGLRRMWSRSTRYDFPVPLLANLGEQTLYNREVYSDGSANDALAFGYVPRWDEYRHIPSMITGLYRSTAAGTIDYWHSAQDFASLPTLNSTFITDSSSVTVQRNFAAGASTAGQQLLADFFFDITCARALPAYGIPGLTRF